MAMWQPPVPPGAVARCVGGYSGEVGCLTAALVAVPHFAMLHAGYGRPFPGCFCASYRWKVKRASCNHIAERRGREAADRLDVWGSGRSRP